MQGKNFQKRECSSKDIFRGQIDIRNQISGIFQKHAF